MTTRSGGRPGVVETAGRRPRLWPPLWKDFASRAAATAIRLRPSLVLLFGAMLLASNAACRHGGKPGTLVIAIEAPPIGFDPRFSSSDGTSARVMQLIYDTLLVKREDFEFAPSLAEHFEESEDQTTFTFHLRAGVTFHNGDRKSTRLNSSH